MSIDLPLTAHLQVQHASPERLDRLIETRATLRERMLSSPLCDGPGFVERLEDTYRTLWRRSVETLCLYLCSLSLHFSISTFPLGNEALHCASLLPSTHPPTPKQLINITQKKHTNTQKKTQNHPKKQNQTN